MDNLCTWSSKIYGKKYFSHLPTPVKKVHFKEILERPIQKGQKIFIKYMYFCQ